MGSGISCALRRKGLRDMPTGYDTDFIVFGGW